MEIDQSLPNPPPPTTSSAFQSTRLYSALSRIFPELFPVSPFEESNVTNPARVGPARQVSARLFTRAPAASVVPGPIRYYEYVSRDKYPPEDAQSMDVQPVDVQIRGIHIVFDHQVSSGDEDPDVMHLWLNKELKVTGRKNHKGIEGGLMIW